jgi:acyl-coenzyme A thioesterase PaaI-like protein
MSGNGVEARALEAIARTRTFGMHLLGHFVGVSGPPSPAGGVRLTLARSGGSVEAATRATPLLAFCVFADLVVGSAIRSNLEAGVRLGTVTLSIQHRRLDVHGEVTGVGSAPPPQDGYGTAQAVYTVGDEVVGLAQGSAASLPAPSGRMPTLLPWERDRLPEVPRLMPADLEPHEALFLANVRAADRRAAVAGTSVEDELLHLLWQPAEPGTATGEVTIGPELGNRVGHVQGGALYTAAARAAGQALGVEGWHLGEGSYQFLRPAEGRTLGARATVLRRGRSMAFVQAHTEVDGVAVGTGLFAFRARTS